MNVSDLIRLPIEPELSQWMDRFHDLNSLLSGLPQLFSSLVHTVVLGKIEDGATIIGPVHVGEGSIVKANAVIVGPVILGSNVVIEHGSIVRDFSYIGSDCRVDCGCIVTGSLVLNQTVLQSMVSLSLAVVGTGCQLGTRSTVGGFCGVGSTAEGTFLGHNTTLEIGTIVIQGAQVLLSTTAPSQAQSL